jgi:flavin reductase (DIM6/NTAB) family NADH-FMN oxidoreductase RutF
MTAKHDDGNVGAGTVNWLTQTSFDPPLVAIGVKTNLGLYAVAKSAGGFASTCRVKGSKRSYLGSLN